MGGLGGTGFIPWGAARRGRLPGSGKCETSVPPPSEQSCRPSVKPLTSVWNGLLSHGKSPRPAVVLLLWAPGTPWGGHMWRTGLWTEEAVRMKRCLYLYWLNLLGLGLGGCCSTPWVVVVDTSRTWFSAAQLFNSVTSLKVTALYIHSPSPLPSPRSSLSRETRPNGMQNPLASCWVQRRGGTGRRSKGRKESSRCLFFGFPACWAVGWQLSSPKGPWQVAPSCCSFCSCRPASEQCSLSPALSTASPLVSLNRDHPSGKTP